MYRFMVWSFRMFVLPRGYSGGTVCGRAKAQRAATGCLAWCWHWDEDWPWDAFAWPG